MGTVHMRSRGRGDCRVWTVKDKLDPSGARPRMSLTQIELDITVNRFVQNQKRNTDIGLIVTVQAVSGSWAGQGI